MNLRWMIRRIQLIRYNRWIQKIRLISMMDSIKMIP